MERLELPEIAFAYARLQAEADAEADETERIKKAINAYAVFQFNKDMFRVTCAYRKSHPAILMVQSAQDRAANDIPGPLNAARDRGILVQ